LSINSESWPGYTIFETRMKKAFGNGYFNIMPPEYPELLLKQSAGA
jgi:hypothetical protein